MRKQNRRVKEKPDKNNASDKKKPAAKIENSKKKLKSKKKWNFIKSCNSENCDKNDKNPQQKLKGNY